MGCSITGRSRSSTATSCKPLMMTPFMVGIAKSDGEECKQMYVPTHSASTRYRVWPTGNSISRTATAGSSMTIVSFPSTSLSPLRLFPLYVSFPSTSLSPLRKPFEPSQRSASDAMNLVPEIEPSSQRDAFGDGSNSAVASSPTKGEEGEDKESRPTRCRFW